MEKIRHHDGDHVFYLYMTGELGILCVTDGIPVDQEVWHLDYVRRRRSASVPRVRTWHASDAGILPS